MREWTLIVIPQGAQRTRRVRLPAFFVEGGWCVILIFLGCLGYVLFDYRSLWKLRREYEVLIRENHQLRGEARILVDQLGDVKTSLQQVDDLTKKLQDLVNLRVNTVSRKTGVGPLSKEEAALAKKASFDKEDVSPSRRLPLTLNLEQLQLGHVFGKLEAMDQQAQIQARHLQQLLLTLTEQQSLLSSIPTVSPVDGWITSDYGHRISPFSGKRSLHRGIDIAAPIGTPILAPADGVVIFSGRKEGYGNFIMIAHHGYGIITRYGHNAQNMVAPGQKVKRGDQIASVGMSGRTTGPHLHYEVWVDGRTVSPRKFMLEHRREMISLL